MKPVVPSGCVGFSALHDPGAGPYEGLVTSVEKYEGDQPADLSFDVGAKISVTSSEGEWWQGYIVGDPQRKVGEFPSNFVE
jgi:hypothetical protein